MSQARLPSGSSQGTTAREKSGRLSLHELTALFWAPQVASGALLQRVDVVLNRRADALANADQNALAVIRKTGLGTTSLGSVTKVDIYRLNQQPDGSLTVDPAHYNSYQISGAPLGAITWPSITRDIKNGEMDFLGITVYYRYNWKTGFFNGGSPLQLNHAIYIRLEPQLY